MSAKNMAIPSLEVSLNEWAGHQSPSSEEKALIRRELDRLMQVIQAEEQGIENVQVAGSVVNQTNLKGIHDADLIVYVNCEPPFTALVARLASCVTMHFRWRPNGPCVLHVDQLGMITAELRDGLRLCVHVSKWLLKASERRLDQNAQQKRQYERSLQWLRLLQHKHRWQLSCSTWLSSAASGFFGQLITGNHLLVHLVRLCKRWDRNIIGLPFIHKRSFTMELLAVAAFLQRKKLVDKVVLLDCFRCFLENWSCIASGDFNRCFSYPQRNGLYSLTDVAASVRSERPLLLDPVDPFCNRLRPFVDAASLTAFQQCARVTLSRLDKADFMGFSTPDFIFFKQDVSHMFS